jgi:hypothetical protein
MDSSQKDLCVNEYLYADTISRRLKMVASYCSKEYYYTSLYFYQGSNLIRVVEMFYSLLNDSNKKIWEKTYNYEYDANNKVKLERITQDGKYDYVSEYIY